LIDLIEILSDTGLGKEMHSVVSQGRIEAIVTSKPRDRRLLIEEAAGLGKHRKRRRRAQIKLGHTQDNLERALDVEREARSRLRPLKRQAEAAELHERVHRQILEVRWELAREELRVRRAELQDATEQAARARARRGEIEAELGAVALRRREAEEALAARSSRREELSRRSYAAQSAADRVGYRADAVAEAGRTVAGRLERAAAELETLTEATGSDRPDPETAHRITELERELAALTRDREAELARQLEELERQLTATAGLEAERAQLAQRAAGDRERAEAAHEQARVSLREAERAVEQARRESARVGGELAAVNQFLRSHQSAPGGVGSLADALTVASGYELAVAAALDGRLGAALLEDRAAAGALLDRAGRDGGRVLVLGVGHDRGAGSGAPTADAARLAQRVAGDDAIAELARRLLADVWVVSDLEQVGDDFTGVAVTTSGRVFVAGTGEMRQAARVGEERVLAERNRREELIELSDATVKAEHAARAAAAAAAAAAAELDADRERAIAAHRGAVTALDEALEEQRRLRAAIERRRSAPDEGPGADRRAQLQLQLGAERERLERAERERQQRAARVARLRAELERDRALAPRISAIESAVRELVAAIAERRLQFDAELSDDREAGEHVAAELRACAQEEAGIQSRLHTAGEALTTAEVRAQRARDQAADAEQSLRSLATELSLEPEAASEAMDAQHREELQAREGRLQKRREQIGPVNPLAQDEYDDALAHVEELEAQRQDLETALRELEVLIKDTDRQIRETFETTYAAAAEHFEELVARVFPGGRGRLRLVAENEAQASVIGGQRLDDRDGEAIAEDEDDASEELSDEDRLGVEIEITPAGKSMKRLSLLSGGEKSMTALAFLFAVFLAKPCPFYVMDEVEAALDDLNISRFLDLLDTYSDRAQFIVVTHQKRTMEAADALYGVAMGGDGVSKVISRRLPAREAA
jgi:chromosome segregation protein